jgi:hypothetical protein
MNALTTDDRQALQSALSETMEASGRKVVAYVLLHHISGWLHLPDSAISSGLSALIVSIIIYILAWLTNRAVKVPISAADALRLAIPPLLAGFCLWMVWLGRQVVFIAQQRDVTKLPATADGFDALRGWFDTAFQVRFQVLACVLGGVLGIISARLLLVDSSSFIVGPGIYVGIFPAMCAVGMGSYFALAMPTIAHVASRHRLQLYPYDPARSRAVGLASLTFGRLALLTGVIAAILMGLFFILQPWGETTTFAIALGWLFFAWALTSYAFLFPGLCVAKAVAAEKQIQVDRLDGIIEKLHSRLDELSPAELEKLKGLVELRDKVFHARTLPMPSGAWARYLLGLVAPTLSFARGVSELGGRSNGFLRF